MTAYQNTISDFVGNDTEISKLIAWLNDIFHGTTQLRDNFNIQELPKFALIISESGNGKTALVYALGNTYKVPILDISPLDVTCLEELKQIKASVDIIPIYCEATTQIVLIDDIDKFNKNYKKQLIESIPKICTNPLIYTCTDTSSIPKSFKNEALQIKLKKPSKDELKTLLHKMKEEFKLKVEDNLLNEIVEKCSNVRSCINSIFSSTANEVINYSPDIYEKLEMAKNKELTCDIDGFTLKVLCMNCKDIESILYLTKLSIKSDTRYFAECDKFFINNAPIKFPGFVYFTNNKKLDTLPTEEESKLAQQLHISVKRLRTDYKFLEVEEVKDKEINIKTQPLKAKMTEDLSSFY